MLLRFVDSLQELVDQRLLVFALGLLRARFVESLGDLFALAIEAEQIGDRAEQRRFGGQLRDDLAAFQNENVELLAISCDPMFSLKAFAEHEGYKFSLLADFWPHGDVAKAYGVFMPERGMASRGTFIIDKSGKVAWSVLNGPGEARDVAAYKAALAAL